MSNSKDIANPKPPSPRVVDAEQRVNLIRISAIAAFYLVHLWHVSAPGLGEKASSIIGMDSSQSISSMVHVSVTVICLGWLMQAFAVHLLIAQHRITDLSATLSTLGDLGWLTALLCLSTGAGGPMVAGYFLILMLTGLRFNLRLVRVTTVVAVICYLILLGVTKWPFGILHEIQYVAVPRYHQIMILLAIIFSGVIMGQIVRHAYVVGDIHGANSTGARK